MTGVLIPTGSEAEWLAARRGGVTASEIAVLMGLSPYGSPYALWHRKRGLIPEQPDNDAMMLGRHMENYVADQFARRHPEFALMGSGRELWRHEERAWQMATPDRTVYEYPGVISGRGHYGDLLAVLECKVDNGDGFGDDGSDVVPVHYRCQVLWQMDVLGVTAGYLACLIWHRRQIRVYQLTLDDAAESDLKLMRGEAEAFLAMQVPPEPDWRPATRDALRHLHPLLEDRDVPIPFQLARWYRAACRDVKLAEQRKARYENLIRARLGSGRRAVISAPYGGRGADEPVARRDVYDLPEKTIVRKATTVDRLVPVKAKEAPQ